jgi:fatty-acyl-CoA synthase
MPPSHIVAALDALKGLHERGYTFIDAEGAETFYSFDRIRAEAAKRAHLLRALGLKKGDRLALVIPDGIDFVPTFLGALWAGVVPVPLYPPLSLGKLDAYQDTLVAVLNKAGPRYLCTTGRVQNLLGSVLGKVPSLEGIVTVQELAKDGPGADDAPERLVPEDLCFLQFTSGSTSAPKGVKVTHASLQANCLAISRDGARMGPQDVAVSWLPLYHDMGLIGFVLTPLYSQSSVVLMPTLSFVKNATVWMETLHRKRATLSFAPNFAYGLVTKRAKPEQLARWDLSRMRLFGCGAEPIHPQTLRAFVDRFAQTKLRPEAILPAYGMAEATLAISFVGLDESLRTDVIDAERYERQQVAAPPAAGAKSVEVVSCGRAFPGHEVAVLGSRGQRLPERTVGELVVRGPSVTPGYFEDPEATALAFRDGWLRTGDLGYLVRGEVHVTGRRKDLLIIRGRNYDPQRLEWLVNALPGVRTGTAVAFSRPGTDSEELVVAAESRSTDVETLRISIRQHLNEQMQLVPGDVVLVPPGTLPKTSSGKLQRQKTRSWYLDGSLGTRRGKPGRGRERLVLAKHVMLSWMGRGRHAARTWWRRAVSRFIGGDNLPAHP